MSFICIRQDVPGYSDHVEGDGRGALQSRPSINGPATLKYCAEDKMTAGYMAQRQASGDSRPAQDIAIEYNDTVIYPDKVRINLYYLDHYSFSKDFQMIFCTILGKKMEYNGEVI